MRAASGLHDLRMHDLRRTLGSWQAINGSSLPVIGQSLGHRSTASTEIYARLTLDPVRESVDGAIKKMLPDSIRSDDSPPDERGPLADGVS